MTHTADMHIRNEVEVGRLSFELANKFPEVPPDSVEDVVRAEFGRRSQRRVQDFVPIFVERRARATLRELSGA